MHGSRRYVRCAPFASERKSPLDGERCMALLLSTVAITSFGGRPRALAFDLQIIALYAMLCLESGRAMPLCAPSAAQLLSWQCSVPYKMSVYMMTLSSRVSSRALVLLPPQLTLLADILDSQSFGPSLVPAVGLQACSTTLPRRSVSCQQQGQSKLLNSVYGASSIYASTCSAPSMIPSPSNYCPHPLGTTMSTFNTCTISSRALHVQASTRTSSSRRTPASPSFPFC